MKKKHKIEVHPAYNWQTGHNQGGFLFNNARVLIMGTFPPRSDYAAGSFFYYPSRQNHFWNRIDNICKTKLKYRKDSNETVIENVMLKKLFCREHKISFLDFFSRICRRNPTCCDCDIIDVENVIGNGFLETYLNNCLNEPKILCTYKTSREQLIRALQAKNIRVFIHNEPMAANNKKFSFRLNNREFEIIQLFAATRSGERKHLKDLQYEYFIFNS